ncbi:MAG: hypothetical protein P1V51_05365 [Deltaproteobacteria bacterium]|nr:hypothetical protein [Deltaproteobacteria bacterium]
MLLLGAGPGSCANEPTETRSVFEAPPEGEAKPEPATEVEAGPTGTVRSEPAAPLAGQPLKIIGGPISFTNGCQGVASVKVEVDEAKGEIAIFWLPKSVEPDAICSMAMHDDPVVASLEGLSAGEYSVKFHPRGGEGRVVVALPEREAPEAGAE